MRIKDNTVGERERITKQMRSLLRSRIKQAERLTKDPHKQGRLRLQYCKFCFYVQRPTTIAGRGFTVGTCLCCGSELQHTTTAIPVLCTSCAKKSEVCCGCGGELAVIDADVTQ